MSKKAGNQIAQQILQTTAKLKTNAILQMQAEKIDFKVI